jgi:hypothetical protein
VYFVVKYSKPSAIIGFYNNHLTMSRILSTLLFLVITIPSFSQIDYFFPEGTQIDASIPSPQDILGYEIGEWHTRHDLMIRYLEALAASTDKVNIQTIGYTNERRPQVVLTITNPAIFNNLELVRQQHLQNADPGQSPASYEDMPVVVLLGYNVHGNEPSSAEAAILTAYYLASAQNQEVQKFLNEAVIFIDPSFNPDGRDRHTTWVNTHKSNPPVSDPVDREHNEAWPRGRTNHYWFDLNRDWFPLTQVESRNRIEFYHQWLPNVVTDFHEMGTNATYFFEPTEPYGSENPVVPRSNYDGLNNLFAKYYEEALNEIGSLYFTKETFDNSYPGYGSTYPDIHGGLGMVFEQASSRGHIQRSNTRDIEFRFTIRNHFRSSLATVKASVENRETLLRHQREFFASAIDEANASPIKAYEFQQGDDRARTDEFLNLLLQHRIKVYQGQGGGSSYIVPTRQPQYRMVRSVFEAVTQFYDSVFYDASTWNMALAYNMDYSEIRTSRFQMGEEIGHEDLFKPVDQPQMTKYAWLVDWNQYYAPKALNYLLNNGVFVKAAFKPFTASVNGAPRDFGYGTILISLYDQDLAPAEVFEVVKEASRMANIEFHTVSTGLNLKGIDLGSNNFRTLSTPKVLMLIGDGVSSYEAGEIWYLFDSKVGMPITKVDLDNFGRVSLSDYSVLIMPSGGYSALDSSDTEKIKEWVMEGGTLYAQRSAVSWAVNNKLANMEFEKFDNDTPERRDYTLAGEYSGATRIGGSVFMADVDITHPLAFGITKRALPVYRNHSFFLKTPQNPYSSIVKYTSNPHVAGYLHPGNLDKLRDRVSMTRSRSGRGHIILNTDNPNFRAYWFGTSKLLFNSVFFGTLY